MRMWRSRKPGFLFWVCMLFLLQAHGQDVSQSDNTGFTYQGRLNEQEQTANGTFDFQFQIFDKVAEGTSLGKVVTLEDVKVTDGYFSVKLDFGSGVFTGDPRFLQIGVRKGNETSDYTVLQPRQEITPAPYALYALNGSGNIQSGGDVGLEVGNNSEMGIAIRAKAQNGPAILASSSKTKEGYSVALCGVLANAFSGVAVRGVVAKEEKYWLRDRIIQLPQSTPGLTAKSVSVKKLEVDIPINLTTQPIGVMGENQMELGGGVGVYGLDSSGGSGGYGGYFYSKSQGGIGAFGVAVDESASKEENAGIYGVTKSKFGYGVLGEGPQIGIKGMSPGESGIGIYGEASNAKGTETVGVKGITYGSSGSGILGEIGFSNQSTHAYGVQGRTRNYLGAGVFGLSAPEHPTGKEHNLSNGVHGVNTGNGGAGVYGEIIGAFNEPNWTYGVHGKNDRDKGAGVYGETNPSGNAKETYGVYGYTWSLGSGVYGEARETDDKTVNFGVKGISKSLQGIGVYGEASNKVGYLNSVGIKGVNVSPFGKGIVGLIDTDGDSNESLINKYFKAGRIGVLGAVEEGVGKIIEGTESIGVAGFAADQNSTGIMGIASYKGESDEAIGVYGLSDSEKGTGVQGWSSSEKEGYGVEGIGTGTNGTGVRGVAKDAGVGVHAESAKGNPFEAWNSSQVVFKVDNSGNAYADGTYQSPAADFAEMLPAAGNLEPGDVLAVGKDGKVVLAGSQNPLSIIGVHSTQPAFLGGHSADNQDTSRVPVAIVGVVPVKVTAENGPILPNDSLTVSPTRAGRAAKAVPLFTLENGQGIYAGGTILGKALTPLSQGEGVVQVLLQLR